MLQSHPNIPIHFQSVSSIAAIEFIHSMKQQRSHLTVGVSPFHLVFSDEHLSHYNQKLKFNPPLRSTETMRLLSQALRNGRVDHLTSLHHPMLGDSQETSFFDHSFGSWTIDSFFQVASHCLLDSQLSLDHYHALLSCPTSLSFAKPRGLGLNSNASFIVLKAVLEALQPHVLFDDVEVELHGGVQVIVKDGEIMNA
jgi:dihydroorotase-like cyclic amidohydrolase